jgi:hypothetical protein
MAPLFSVGDELWTHYRRTTAVSIIQQHMTRTVSAGGHLPAQAAGGFVEPNLSPSRKLVQMMNNL